MNLNYFQKQRLLYIDELVNTNGEIKREDIAEKFDVASATTTRDLTLYRKLRPRNIKQHRSTGVWKKTGLYTKLTFED